LLVSKDKKIAGVEIMEEWVGCRGGNYRVGGLK
jgi:hypothetical protein